MTRLAEFVAGARQRADQMPETSAPDRREHSPPRRSLRRALGDRTTVAVIAEFKRRSPSHGNLAGEGDPAAYAQRVAASGAAALSILTEPRWFHGTAQDLVSARAAATLPVQAKDFLVDPRQVAEAARHGADAVLLIVRCLADQELQALIATARAYAVEVVLECHDEAELERALAVPDAMIGVNNRDLDTLAVDMTRARRLLPRVPPDRCAIAESGYSSADEIRALRGLANGALIGASILRGTDLATLVAAGRS